MNVIIHNFLGVKYYIDKNVLTRVVDTHVATSLECIR